METEIRAFVVNALSGLNYNVSQVTGDTDLGPAGLDLESLAVAELAVLVENRFGVRFSDEDAEELALMTLEEFTAEVARRVTVPAGGSPE